MTNKQIFGGIAALVLILAIVVAVFQSSTSIPTRSDIGKSVGNLLIEDYDPYVRQNGGVYTNLEIKTSDNLESSGTLTVSGASTIGSATLSGKLTTNAGHLRSYTNSTSTVATSQTLEIGDILDYESMLMVPNTGALTLTFPASSTMSTLVPTAGDRQDFCIVNSTSTAAATITLATNTGLALQRVATSTTSGSAGMLAIPANGSACVKFVRQTATASAFDIQVLVENYISAE